MNEEFAATLKLVLDESSIAKVKERLKSLNKELSQTINVSVGGGNNISSPVIKPDVDMSDVEVGIKSYQAQIEALANKLGDLMTNLSAGGLSTSQFTELSAEIERINNRLVDLIDKQKQLNAEASKSNVNFKKISEGIAQATGGAKKFVLALIGARTVYFGIRKAMSAYLSQNDDLQNKLNACWYALGSLFAPVLEYIVNLFATLIGYVNVFLRALGLAGINMSSYAKSAGSAAKSTKQLQVSGIDEINNVGSDESSGGGAGGGVGNPLGDIELDSGIVSILETIGAWCSANLPIIAGLIAGVAAAIMAVKLGCDLITACGIGILVAGIVMTIGYLLQYLQDPSWANFGGIISGIGVALLGLSIIIASVPVAIAGAIVLVLGLLASNWEAIQEWWANCWASIDETLALIEETMGLTIASIFAIVFDTVRYLVQIVMNLLDGLFKGVKNIVDGIIKICKGDLKGGLQLIFKGIANICIGLVNSCISATEGLINIVIDGINVLLGGISDIASGVGSLFGLSPVNIRLNKVSFSRIPSLNVGTNYVPNDMLAQIHQGEAIIPKKFNSSDFFGNTSAEELTLLANIVDQLEELNKKDTTINLDGDNVAEKINNRLESLKQRQGNRVFALAR